VFFIHVLANTLKIFRSFFFDTKQSTVNYFSIQ